MEDFTIPAEEDILYEMAVNNKRYQASFYQKPDLTDTLAIQTAVKEKILQKYSEKEVESMTEEEAQSAYNSIIKSLTMDVLLKKSVWFLISEYAGNYFIIIYYH